MNETQTMFQTMNDTMKTGMKQWQDALQAWNGFVIEATQQQFDAAFAVREQSGKLWAEANKRSGEMAKREQKMVVETSDLWRAQIQANADLATQLTRSMTEASRAFSTETGRAMQAQAQAAQEQMSDIMQQATEVAQAAAESPANGTRTRVKG
jgi:hypothetical protein